MPAVSQLELSTILELSQGQVSRIESGKTIVNDLEKLARWSQALGFSDKHLWFDCPEPDGSVEPSASQPYDPWNSDSSDHDYIDGPAENAQTADSQSRRVRTQSRTLCNDDVSVLLETTNAFRQLDNRFGGGHVRSAVAAYLIDEVEPALQVGRFSRGVRRDFQRASAELNQLVGWMAYDVGDDTSGRRYLRRALEISSDANDDALSAEMLAAMSHQAASAGRADEVLDFAISAKRSAVRSGAPALQAEAAALEAQGYALQHNRQQCLSALRRAEQAFNRVTTDNTPPWLQ